MWVMWVVLPVLNLIHCDYEFWSNGFLENSLFAVKQVYESTQLKILLFAWIIALVFYNGLGINVTYLVSASNRIISTRLKIIFIWIFFLIYPYGGHESFKPLQLIGFILLSIGVMIYNEVIVINAWGLGDNLMIKGENEFKTDHYIEFKDDTIEHA